MAQYTYTGYDASAHMSEETRQASRSAAVGVVMSVVMSVIFGFILLVAVTFAIPDVQGTINAGAFDITYIWQNAMSTRWAEFLLTIACVAQFFCGAASVTAASRMMFAFSRDGAVPGGRRLFRKVTRTHRVPVNAVIAIAVLSWALMLPTLANGAIGYLVGTSIAVIGLYIAYIIPVFLRLRNPDFEQGEWNLGRYSKLVGWTAVVWVVFVSLYFFMPVYPVLGFLRAHQYRLFANNFNWSGPVILISFIAVTIYWFVSAKNWFNGPKVQGTREELMTIEHELESGKV